MTFSQFLKVERFTGWHMFAIICLFFGVIISVNLTLAYYANSTWTGLVVKNSYVASQKFNEQTAKNKQQMALGWRVDLNYDGRQVNALVIDRQGLPVKFHSLRAIVGRPAFEASDHQISFMVESDGSYRAKTQLEKGVWQVRLEGETLSGDVFQRAIRFNYKGR